MATKAKARKPLPLGVRIPRKGEAVLVPGEGIKLGERGKARSAGELFSLLSKGEARKVRKALRRAGECSLAGARREP
jgi:hypothetical protein